MSGRRFRETEEEEKRRGTIGPEVGGGSTAEEAVQVPDRLRRSRRRRGPAGEGSRQYWRSGPGEGRVRDRSVAPAPPARLPRGAGRWHSRACTMIDLMDE